MNIIKKVQPLPAIMAPRLSKIQVRTELGVVYILVDGETRLAMNTDQFIEFFQRAIQQAYQGQSELNRIQQKAGDPTVHCKTGTKHFILRSQDNKE